MQDLSTITQPQAKASKVINETQIKILSRLTAIPRDQLQTIESAMSAVAKVGGHQKRNGPPGWQILFRGYEKLLLLEQGWTLAQGNDSKEMI